MKRDARQELIESLLSLRSHEEIAAFLEDLCTPAEIEAMAERWRVAKLVHRQIPYRRIHELTGVSTATITRVARSLTYGNGYANLLKKEDSKT